MAIPLAPAQSRRRRQGIPSNRTSEVLHNPRDGSATSLSPPSGNENSAHTGQTQPSKLQIPCPRGTYTEYYVRKWDYARRGSTALVLLSIPPRPEPRGRDTSRGYGDVGMSPSKQTASSVSAPCCTLLWLARSPTAILTRTRWSANVRTRTFGRLRTWTVVLLYETARAADSVLWNRLCRR